MKPGIIFICLLYLPLFSQKSSIVFDHYGYNQGFTSRSSRGVVKASNGFIYISTEQGLAKYDGNQFTYFSHNPADTSSLSDNYLKDICQDKHGRLWIVSGNDINVFDLKTESTSRVYPRGKEILSKHFDPLCFLYDTIQDKVWIGTEHGLFWNQGDGISIQPYTFTDAAKNAISINAIVADDRNTLWLGTPGELYALQIRSRELTEIALQDKYSQNDKISGFMTGYMTEDHMLWLGTWTQGLVKYDIRSQQYDNFHFTGAAEQNGVLAINQSALKKENGLLWVGTTKGLMTFDILSQKFTSYVAESIDDMYGVPSSVWDFYNASPEGMWIASHNGLHRYDFNKQIFGETYFPNPKNEIRTFNVSNFDIDRSDPDIAWMFVPGIGNFKYRLSDNSLSAFPHVVEALVTRSSGIFNTYIDAQNILWISTNDNGLLGYDITMDSLLYAPRSFFNKNWVYSFLEYQGILYLGTRNGLFRYDREGNTFEDIESVNQSINDHQLTPAVYDMDFDEHGQLWLQLGHKPTVTDNGLLAYNTETKEIKFIKASDNIVLSILATINDIHVGSDQEMYVSSLNGIAHFKTQGDFSDIGLYTKQHGMISNSVIDLVEDHSGNIWCSGNFGIMAFNMKSKTFRNFSQTATSIGKSEYPMLYYDHHAKSLYVFQNNYYNVLHPQDLTYYPSSISITSIQINNKETKRKDRKWVLNHDQNQIYISFSLLSYTNSSDNIYKYKLEDGTNINWVETKENHARFDKLAPGHYVFIVKGTNGFGIQSDNEERIEFRIRPPFIQSICFLLILFAGLFAALFSFFKYREKQAGKMHKLRLAIARDLHDEMGSTLSNILMMSELEILKSGEKGNRTLEKVAVKIREVMDSMSDIVWSINPQHDRLEDVVIKIQHEVIEALEPRDIALKFFVQPISEKIAFSISDRRDLYLIFKEAINNIAKHADAKHVTFTYVNSHRKYSLSIQDDGKGFAGDQVHTGNGLKNMRARAEKLGCTLQLVSDAGGTTIHLEKL